MVLAKDELCSAVERAMGEERAGAEVASILRSGNERELDAAYKKVGLGLMEAGKRGSARELVEVWRRRTEEGAAVSIEPKTKYSLEDEDEEDQEVEIPSLAKGLGLAMGLGKAFGKGPRASTTDGLAAANTGDHSGAVTKWQGEDELTAMARRLSSGKTVALELAKAELVAVVRSKLGSKGSKIVEKIHRSAEAQGLQLAVGEAQRKLVRAGMPRLAAKLAKKWIEFHGHVE